ncbi:nitrogenase cofactor biosynthesis protein NifB [Anaerosacchariphilus polymeriproducens]|uniref:Nitrogenase cofactor biosynthesis protein NifB n=1 Tax=Anaerosacchariphilus polymeriproducens TaxID=1812858 RepID=A0A371AUC3_9FIRM|nr:nitrogenase cofactor biosynthesis protein NifB [Anaerosacchariphilus polymeriproducens]RDU23142.1 nitrogenase cofactor biosynthesis protein NifB [Anaerosacchariphilus polymeriproducens]
MTKSKIEPFVNLNVNPCKMCMPMGAVTAFYGIKECISMLHGSQGCSTYIRRHMATHYNEPVDIASSSLTEQGTVYGGEKNLINGLKNLIELYHPKVIGVATTCLAETIGEDVTRIIEKFYRENKEYQGITIIPVNSPGYGGTQYEGYFGALRTILEFVPMNCEKNNKVNVITSILSPKDTRFLKRMFQSFGIDIILLPDLSSNLDGVFKKTYDRLPSGGTSIEEIKDMAGAKLTLEFMNLELESSPGKYLEEQFGVPYRRLNLPIGLRDTDAFIKTLSQISGNEIPGEIVEERGRYLDAMIDSHKYNAEGRAVIFGEPDFVCSTVRLCVENGIIPLVSATGTTKKQMKELIEQEIKEVYERFFIKDYEIIDDVDFKKIENLTEKLDANILIGNSDGRRIEENLQIPLVRRGFPIHDRVGGQRLIMLGYEGSLSYLDDITNAICSKKETTFRDTIYQTYFENAHINNLNIEIEEKTKKHPCFNGCASNSARIHLPVAPRCNIQCNYCVRKFDCPNESRPGVTTKVLTPEEAFEKYKIVKSKIDNLNVVGIAGPGDALANFEETKETLKLIRDYDKNITFCLSTNGLMLPKYANELCDLGVSHVTVTINAVDVKIGAKIYQYVHYNGLKFEGESAAAILLANQLSGLRILVGRGVICKVNIVTLKGINDKHIPDIVKKVKDIGCYITNIMPFIKVKGSKFENLEPVSNKEVNIIRKECADIMKQMYHCVQCRADAIGTLDQDKSIEFEIDKKNNIKQDLTETYRFAVASKSGVLVDQHFGQTLEFHIYDYKDGRVIYKEIREINNYCHGEEVCEEYEDKLEKLLHIMKDCNGIIAMRIGENLKNRLHDRGMKVIVTYDRIEEAVKYAVQSM